jgi:transcriptional regulator GlxA family with amidase domain
MFGSRRGGETERIGFFLVPQFSMMAFFSAVEPLRVANRFGGRPLYSWHIVSRDGAPVPASNGMVLIAETGLAQAPHFETLIVCAGFEPLRGADRGVLAWLRRLDRRGADLGTLDTGCYVLAKAGLLDGHRTAVHWEALESFAEAFPKVEVVPNLFEIDRNRFSCSGGTAAIDLMLHMIELQHGHELAASVSEQFIHDRIRDARDHQRMALRARLGAAAPKLLRAIAVMEANLEEPLEAERVARLAGLSVRQIERLFRQHLKTTPKGYYLELRLNRARALLLHTSMPVLEVGIACGFTSPAHFSRAYRAHFAKPPRAERHNPPAET